jgi:hypothetical protein
MPLTLNIILNGSRLYWHFETSESSTHVVFPLWWKYQHYLKNDTLTRKILFPVYFHQTVRKSITAFISRFLSIQQPVADIVYRIPFLFAGIPFQRAKELFCRNTILLAS